MRLCAVLLVVALLAAPAEATPSTGDVRQALAVLHGWDQRRELAWAASDETALRALYAPGSSAARADVRLLRSYTARGLVVRRLETQLFGVRVLARKPRRLVVRILDRVAGGEVATHDRVLPLASSPPQVRRLVLERVAGAWRVVAVTG